MRKRSKKQKMYYIVGDASTGKMCKILSKVKIAQFEKEEEEAMQEVYALWDLYE